MHFGEHEITDPYRLLKRVPLKIEIHKGRWITYKMDSQTFASFLQVLQEIHKVNSQEQAVYYEAIRNINNGARIMDYLLEWSSLRHYVNLFAFEEIDLTALGLMTEFDFIDIGVAEIDMNNMMLLGMYCNLSTSAVRAQSG